jgi:hypothetical protein
MKIYSDKVYEITVEEAHAILELLRDMPLNSTEEELYKGLKRFIENQRPDKRTN